MFFFLLMFLLSLMSVGRGQAGVPSLIPPPPGLKKSQSQAVVCAVAVCTRERKWTDTPCAFPRLPFEFGACLSLACFFVFLFLFFCFLAKGLARCT